MLAAGRTLLPDATWLAGDASTAGGQADLVVASYVLGELDDPAAAARLWDRTADTVAFVEPGTPAGYARVLSARAAALAAGVTRSRPARTTSPAPCPRTTGATSPSGFRARGCTGGRRAPSSATRTRALVRRGLARARSAGSGADHQAAAGAIGPRQPRHLRARRDPDADREPEGRRALQGGARRRLGRHYRARTRATALRAPDARSEMSRVPSSSELTSSTSSPGSIGSR